jgi:hypothetical protein
LVAGEVFHPPIHAFEYVTDEIPVLMSIDPVVPLVSVSEDP